MDVCPQVEVLQEEVIYATEEVEQLTKVLDEQAGLLQASQDQTAQKEAIIQTLQEKVTDLFLYIYKGATENGSRATVAWKTVDLRPDKIDQISTLLMGFPCLLFTS